MEREIIERLAIDSASGELNEDAEVLLEAYFAEHPEANRWSEDMLRIYEKTEATINAKTSGAEAGIGRAAAGTNLLSQVSWLAVGRWAAVLFLAAFIGVGLGRWSKSEPITGKSGSVTVSPSLMVKRPGYAVEDTLGSFWRAKAIASLKPRPYRGHKAYMQFGGLWERYRQYIKEKNYE